MSPSPFEEWLKQQGVAPPAQDEEARNIKLRQEFERRGLPARTNLPIGVGLKDINDELERTLLARGPEELIQARQAAAPRELARSLNRPLVTPEMVQRLPGPLQPIGSAARELTSPTQLAALLATAGLGPAIAPAIRGGTGAVGAARGLAAGALEPIVQGPLAARLAAEAGVGTAATLAGMETGKLVQNAPVPIRIGAPLAAGLAGGVAGLGAIRAAAPAVRAAAPVAKQIAVSERSGNLAPAAGKALDTAEKIIKSERGMAKVPKGKGKPAVPATPPPPVQKAPLADVAPFDPRLGMDQQPMPKPVVKPAGTSAVAEPTIQAPKAAGAITPKPTTAGSAKELQDTLAKQLADVRTGQIEQAARDPYFEGLLVESAKTDVEKKALTEVIAQRRQVLMPSAPFGGAQGPRPVGAATPPPVVTPSTGPSFSRRTVSPLAQAAQPPQGASTPTGPWRPGTAPPARPAPPRQAPVAAVTPPEKPPTVPPTTIATASPDDYLKRLASYIHSPESANLWDLTKEMRRKEAGRRFGALQKRTDELLAQGVGYEEAMKQAKEVLSGPYARPASILAEDLATDFRETGFAKINEVLRLDPVERTATAEALTHALLGKAISRDLGGAGGSRYTRLSRVFPPEVVEALMKGKPLEQTFEEALLKAGKPAELNQAVFDYLNSLPTVPYGQAGLGEKGWTPQGLPAGWPTRAQQAQATESLKLELAPKPGTIGPSDIQGLPNVPFGQAGLGEKPFEFRQLAMGTPVERAESLISTVKATYPDIRTLPEGQRDALLHELKATGISDTDLGRLQLELWPDVDPRPITAYEPAIEKAVKQPSLMPDEAQHLVIRSLKEAGWTAIDIGNFLRANKASFDFSFWRQVQPLILNNKRDFVNGNVSGWRGMWDGKFAKQAMKEIENDPLYPHFYDDFGADFLRPLETPLGMRAKAVEEFGYLVPDRPIPAFTMKLPWVKFSQRGFVTATNVMLWGIYKRHYANMLRVNERIASGAVKLKPGQSFSIEKEMRGMSKLLEDMSGRASLGKAKELGPVLGGLLFAPRYALGRLISPRHLFSPNKYTRIEAWKDAATTIGGFGGLLVAGEQMGLWDVEYDLRSSDFAKIRVGNTRIDPWGGYQPFARYFSQVTSQILTGRGVKSTRTGEVKQGDPLEATTRFIRGKASPLAAMVSDFATGKTYVGDDVNIKDPKYALDQISPLLATDIYEAVKASGPLAGLLAVPGAVGAGISTYPSVPVAWQKDMEPYFAIPTNETDRTAKYNAAKTAEERTRYAYSRDTYRKNHPDVDAKLFIAGQTSAFQTALAGTKARNLILQNNIKPTDVKGIKSRMETVRKAKAAGLTPPASVTVDRLIRELAVQQPAGRSQTPAVPPKQSVAPTLSFDEQMQKLEKQYGLTPSGAR